tara:strand:- start:12507 stop:13613 length:1107 start_codon:yes stop_codon:yes gene_type:complete
MSQINVNLGKHNSYKIFIERDLINKLNLYVKQYVNSKKYIVISHQSIFDLYGKTITEQLSEYNLKTIMIAEGEQSKALSDLNYILSDILEDGVERQDCIIALGGGVIGDLAGFAASICLRGIKLIHIPTTLLAQVDSAIGGKTGINHKTGKNLIGSFYQPNLILMDPNLLRTLPVEEIRSGFAEIIKYGVISDKALFDFLVKYNSELKTFDLSTNDEKWDFIIERSAQNKVDVVSEDEKESHLRAILNFGHTIGHGLEAIFGNYDFRHGECVAFGMICATFIAYKKDLISDDDAEQIYSLILNFGFSLKLPAIDLAMLHKKMSIDKKVINGKIKFILPTKIGHVVQDDTVTKELIEESILFLNTKLDN